MARGRSPLRQLCRKRPSDWNRSCWQLVRGLIYSQAWRLAALEEPSSNCRALLGGGCVASTLCCPQGELLTVLGKPEDLRPQE